MKITISIISFFAFLLCFTACKKASTPSSNNTGGVGTQLVRIQQGTDPTEDTVLKIVYTGNNIHYIYDSVFDGDTSTPDTLYATYDGSGKLISAADNGNVSATYTYNSSGMLTQIDNMQFGEHEIYNYTYTGGVISQKTWATDAGQGGTPILYRVSNYTVTNGNISEIKLYDRANNLQDDLTFTYGSQAQSATFKQLGLLNIGNLLGIDNFSGFDDYSLDSYFNSNVINSFTEVSSGSVATFTNTFNSGQLPVKIVNNIPGTINSGTSGLFTWFFTYQ
jgi:YD repeat-containing protein